MSALAHVVDGFVVQHRSRSHVGVFVPGSSLLDHTSVFVAFGVFPCSAATSVAATFVPGTVADAAAEASAAAAAAVAAAVAAAAVPILFMSIFH